LPYPTIAKILFSNSFIHIVIGFTTKINQLLLIIYHTPPKNCIRGSRQLWVAGRETHKHKEVKV